MSSKSYANGTCNTPLLGETISDNLFEAVQKYPNREALVVPHQNYRVDYATF